ncbi:adenylyltransferase/cytidyltransferase family protein [Rhizobium laguerreae]|uniref:adenylyltransferase/cytidyltransferase family protein n=1 Tax=Rhizobium laguerreae TaxID=1076926 RepID=UPI001C917003|nr:adenylyltransferase/cytidyltransferase family protein [Rhizobium laguerreae]MBY3347971.1 adenylyltransferase/cytidyltransferase family protein [Rhizobium laguerreae]MBY3354934.1 adenylyltransferase/cytidyltransferase family protein [Rhizobium laguerreae]MBY3376239.1 adenylyltransferase/cytidyltransferase family protein [Rhizobium laguerreae]MBY3431238.1 adenylyltransferase/cytidyltransferase family protein [Rhizobium laguerreae]MBY3439854.1 adenylyltransferase/cytidyltransferase family prot
MATPKTIVGYTTGVFDMFHIGHLHLLEYARNRCDHLIVAVTTDRLCLERKRKVPIITERERVEIVKSVRYVDEVLLEDDPDKICAWNALKFDIIFKGDDWRGTPSWVSLEAEFARRNVKVEYVKYTNHISSTMLRLMLADRVYGEHEQKK